jgi:CspA family cold shock protein
MNTGTVKFFNNSKGFGFIIQDGKKDDIFFHASALEGQTIDEGTKVSYDIGESPKGPSATNVRQTY